MTLELFYELPYVAVRIDSSQPCARAIGTSNGDTLVSRIYEKQTAIAAQMCRSRKRHKLAATVSSAKNSAASKTAQTTRDALFKTPEIYHRELKALHQLDAAS